MTRLQKTCISLGLALGMFAAVPALAAPEAAATVLMTKDLADMPGKEVISFIVDFPPGSVDPVHRHDAHAFIYVLEGSIVMGVKGGKEVTFDPRPDVLRRPGRHPHRRPQRQQDQAREVLGDDGQGQGRAFADAGQVASGKAFSAPAGSPISA